jgi:GAF domain-containing protein
MAAQLPQTCADLEQQVAELTRELAEAREQQAATGEILRVIAGSPTHLPSVLDTVLQNAARLCDASGASIWRVEGNDLIRAADFGSLGIGGFAVRLPLTREFIAGRAAIDGHTIHVSDVTKHQADLPLVAAIGPGARGDFALRTMLGIPLVREGTTAGALVVARTEVRPFSEQQIALLETFADQAVIAIENARLFEELEDRNRELSETLEQQTATAEVLRVVATSPTALQPVLDALVASLARLTGATIAVLWRVEGDRRVGAAEHGPEGWALTAPVQPLDDATVTGRSILQRATVYSEDTLTDERFPISREQARTGGGHRTMLAVPLLREGRAIGTLNIAYLDVRPLDERTIGLVETFADQAVIAIENARLFGELQVGCRSRPERGCRFGAASRALVR